jgi:phosphatidylglycerophosphate synthase
MKRTTEIEEITNLYFIHPLAARLVPLFARMRITPNTVTVMGMVSGILAGLAYYHYQDIRFAITGFVLMLIWHVMDGADGQLARYTQTYSYFGKVLDGISDNVTFLAVYTALAIALSARFGGWIYALVALAAACHSIQSASYETLRQEYDHLGRERKPQGPAPKENREGSPVVRGLFDFLHELFYGGMSFPTARSIRDIRQTVTAALEREPANAAVIRERFREILAPQLRGWSVLSANYRTLGIFITAALQAPQWYFAFEIVGFSALLAVLIGRLGSARKALRSQLQ